MKKGLIALIIVIAAIAIFMLTKDTTHAPSEGMVDDSKGTENMTDTTTPPAPPLDQKVTDSEANTTAQEVTVTYGPNGFEPKSVSIKLGQKVTWVNESENSMWVASSKHPMHADYPEKTAKDCLGSAFDQCEASAMGTSYSFTFNKKGSWNYHNHVAPNNWGTVVVE